MYQSPIESSESVGSQTVAITIAAPNGFQAEPGQFVLIKTEINGEEETGYYTISSPEVTNEFEITIGVDPEGTLGPWLADQSVGTVLSFDGPYGDIRYTGTSDAAVLAAGPGIGPAVGIGERAIQEDSNVVIGYRGDTAPHEDRIRSIRNGGGKVVLAESVNDVVAQLESVNDGRTVYVFGFANFVKSAKDALENDGIPLENLEIESFGPA